MAILKKMKTLAKDGVDSNPDIVTYNTVLSAWSHSGDENAAPYAERIVRDMQTAAADSADAPQPNTVTYNTILNAFSKSSKSDASQEAESFFKHLEHLEASA